MDEQKKTYLGLSSVEAKARLQKYGPNDVVEQKSGIIKKFLAPLYSPISLMLLGAAILSLVNKNVFNFYFILALYILNFAVQKWQEFKADRAIKELQNKLAFDVSTMRDGKWQPVNAKSLAPGDHIRLGLGSMIPADGTIVAINNLAINEAVLTGESLPKEKKVGDKVYSSSFISTGNLEATITATGRHTSFGKTIFSIEPSTEKSMMERDILTITRFLTATSVIAVAVLSVVLYLKGTAIGELLTLDLSLIIAGIPIALPVVTAVILSIGAAGLAKKSVVVRRLSALQDLADVTMLLTDKTGTLTKNEISITKIISYAKDLTEEDIIERASYDVSPDTPDSIDAAITKRFVETGRTLPEAKILHFTPYDAERKRTTMLIEREGKKLLLSLGAPQVIQSLEGKTSPEILRKFEADIEDAAKQGFRVLALAAKEDSEEEKDMQIEGLLFLADPLEEHSAETLQFMQEHGISVKILTGDNRLITERIAAELKLSGAVIPAEDARALFDDPEAFAKKYKDVSAFAEILPKDKHDIVRAFKTQYIVASTGDGINDLPALKIANVGIAVAGGVSALKSLADIVLLGEGIGVIRDAIIESRKIFVRLYNYSVYRISESFRLVVTVLILGVWYGSYPLGTLQLILLAFLNDIPIISLAVDRVKISSKPSVVNSRDRFTLSLLFGLVGVLESLSLFYILYSMRDVFGLSIAMIQTMFFLKLTVSGHALIFVAHTKERWWRFLPSKQVIIATLGTQAVATTLALTGFMMPVHGAITVGQTAFVWLWVLIWMQAAELVKYIQARFLAA